jgi:hypothetical protein
MTSSNLTPKESAVVPVESAPYPPGASSPQQAALIHGQQAAARQNNMNKTGGKRRRQKKYHGGAQTVPTFSSTGPTVGAGGQSPNGASASANASLSQGGANSVCDNCYGANSNSEVCQGPQCNPSAMKRRSCNAGLISRGGRERVNRITDKKVKKTRISQRKLRNKTSIKM